MARHLTAETKVFGVSKPLPDTALRLRQRMEEVGITQQDLAVAVGATQGAVSQILTGRSQKSRFLPHIAEVLQVNLNWLMGVTDEKIDMRDLNGALITEDELAAMRAGLIENRLSDPQQLKTGIDVLGKRIARRMSDLGVNQTAVARMTGLKQPSIGRLLSGETRRTTHLIELAHALQTTPQYLTGESDDPRIPTPVIDPHQKRIVQLGVMLPSEDDLAEMFESLLVLVPEGASRVEAARILAQQLPTGFEAIQFVQSGRRTNSSLADPAASQTHTKDHPASSRQ